jgi:voltage-gated potassium channel
MNKLISATDTIKELLVWYVCILVSSSLIYGYFEGKTLGDSLWWAGVTAMTVGYGDMYPQTTGGRMVAFLLMHTTVLFILPLMIARICNALTVNKHEFTHEEQEEILRRLRDLKCG